jgi:hypothetical protein
VKPFKNELETGNLNLEEPWKETDCTGHAKQASRETNGSWYYFEYDEALNNLTIEKVHCQRRLTVVNSKKKKS